MLPINIYALSRVKDTTLFSQYEQLLSHRFEHKKINCREQESLCTLVDTLISASTPLFLLDGFYFGFSINQISKEFDLLKISADKTIIINIELKSSLIPLEDIQKQLIKNQYYLSHITKNIISYTYISSDNVFFMLNDKTELLQCHISDVKSDLEKVTTYLNTDLQSLFNPSDFLISPINNPEKFFNHKYFLTSQQDEFETRILKTLDFTDYMFTAITGFAGTGKTLLLYDIAKKCSCHGNVCIIHCGKLSNGHYKLNNYYTSIDVISVRDVKCDTSFSKYKYIFIDEAQRIYTNQFEILTQTTISLNLKCFFSFDSNQVLSNEELDRNMPEKIKFICKRNIYNLSTKIRTNKELSSFIKTMLKITDDKTQYPYNHVNILWANNNEEAKLMVSNFKHLGYTFINYTLSIYNPSYFDFFSPIANYNTHDVLGQEFDNVILILNNSFFYNENNELFAYQHPNPNYLYHKLLFQALTRVRQNLCIIVTENKTLFEKLLSIKTKHFNFT